MGKKNKEEKIRGWGLTYFKRPKSSNQSLVSQGVENVTELSSCLQFEMKLYSRICNFILNGGNSTDGCIFINICLNKNYHCTVKSFVHKAAPKVERLPGSSHFLHLALLLWPVWEIFMSNLRA